MKDMKKTKRQQSDKNNEQLRKMSSSGLTLLYATHIEVLPTSLRTAR